LIITPLADIIFILLPLPHIFDIDIAAIIFAIDADYAMIIIIDYADYFH
jgi:hypothetical protein